MKSFLPIAAFILVFSSCSTYRSGQTPDDVYYSPVAPQESSEYVTVPPQDAKKYNYEENQNTNDAYLRMRVYDRQRWSLLEDDYYYPSYSYVPGSYSSLGLGYYFSNPWNNYMSWNYAYNPYFSGYYGSYNNYYGLYNYHLLSYVPATPVYNRPRTYNLNVYKPVSGMETHPTAIRVFGSTNTSTPSHTQSNYRGSGSNAGNFLRNVFGNNGGSYNNGSSFGNNNNMSGSRSMPSSGGSSGSSGSRSSAPASSGRRF